MRGWLSALLLQRIQHTGQFEGVQLFDHLLLQHHEISC